MILDSSLLFLGHPVGPLWVAAWGSIWS